MKINGNVTLNYSEDDIRELLTRDIKERGFGGEIEHITIRQLGRMEDNAIQANVSFKLTTPPMRAE